MVEMTTYQAKASRDGKYWLVHVPAIDKYTQARNLTEVEPMARDLIALWLNVDPTSFDVVPKLDLPADVERHLALAAEAREQAAYAQAAAAREYREAALALREKGLTVRDVGAALGVSFQRAQQLVTAAHKE